ncbi:hypothetical protein [Streptomyces sp. NPDC060065]|uniref:hypothetical protein n=1 Tax=Streptomyces sp. NPDC060065 TaxID=3347050 RepID=UPI00369EB5D9
MAIHRCKKSSDSTSVAAVDSLLCGAPGGEPVLGTGTEAAYPSGNAVFLDLGANAVLEALREGAHVGGGLVGEDVFEGGSLGRDGQRVADEGAAEPAHGDHSQAGAAEQSVGEFRGQALTSSCMVGGEMSMTWVGFGVHIC